MKGFKEKTFNDRRDAANEARQAALDKFRARPSVDDPAVIKRREEREAIAAAREIRDAERKATKEAEAVARAEREAVEKVEREARERREAVEKVIRRFGCGCRAQGRARRQVCRPQGATGEAIADRSAGAG